MSEFKPTSDLSQFGGPFNTPFINEDVCGRFEKAWLAGQPCAIEDQWPKTDSPSYIPTLEELVQIDLEFRWKSFSTGSAQTSRRYVEDYLRRFPELDQAEIVTRLIRQEFRVRLRFSDPPSAEEFRARFPTLVGDSQVFLNPTLPLTDGSIDVLPAETSVAIDLQFGDLRQHARGGLGEVLVAEDEKLGRRVAIKQIRQNAAWSTENVRRFMREARITAQLEHPGIVPVHGLGIAKDGRPCYAMRFVEGRTLGEAIDAFHGSGHSGMDASAYRVGLRHLVQRFVAVCQTIAYAHSKGVIHRDIKPSNIMLGPYGETLVVDWGLARRLSEQVDSTDQQSFALASALDSSEMVTTAAGQVLGTPAYMSPEQAAGRNEEIGTAADIYSLGAVLYHLSCGRPPFKGNRVADILARVERGDFPTPRTENANVPRVLEAICLKAMALRPANRYADATALATDVDKWLADEPIGLIREPLGVRALRWGRKHRSTATGIMVLIVTALVALVVGLYVLNAEKVRTEKARENAVEQETAARKAGEREKRERENAQQLAELKEAEAYDAYMILASREWEGSQSNRVRQILQMFEPTTLDQKDLRGFEWYYFDRLARPERYESSPAWSEIVSSPDGKLLAGLQNGIVIWSAESLSIDQSIGGREDGFRWADFDREGKRVVACAGDKTVRIYDRLSGKVAYTFREHAQGAFTARFTPDGKQIVSRGPSLVAKKDDLWVWRVDDGRTIHRWQCDADIGQASVAISPDGKVLYALDNSRIVRFDLAKGTRLLPKDGNKLGVEDDNPNPFDNATFGAVEFALSPDGRRIALGDAFRQLRVLDSGTGAALHGYAGPFGFPLKVAFSPDSELVAVSGNNSLIHVLDMTTGKQVRTLRGDGTPASSMAFAKGGSHYLASSFLTSTKIWDNAATFESRTIALGTSEDEIAFSADATEAAISNRTTGDLMIYDLPQWKLRLRLPGKGKKFKPLLGLRFSPDGSLIAEVRKGSAVEFYHKQPIEREPRFIPSKAESQITCGEFSPDGRHFATGHHDGVIRIHPLFHEEAPIVLKGDIAEVRALAFDRNDANRLASGGDDRIIRVWDVLRQRVEKELSGHATIVHCIAFSPDGNHLVSSAMDADVLVWDAHAGTIRHRLAGHSGLGIRAAFSPEGDRVATSDRFSNTLKLFDVKTGRETLVLPDAHPNPKGLVGPLFVANGQTLVAAGSNMVKQFESRPISPREQLRQFALACTLDNLEAEIVNGAQLRLKGRLVNTSNGPAALPSRLVFSDSPFILRAHLRPHEGGTASPAQIASSFFPNGPLAAGESQAIIFDVDLKNITPGHYRVRLESCWSKAVPQIVRGRAEHDPHSASLIHPISQVEVAIEIGPK